MSLNSQTRIIANLPASPLVLTPEMANVDGPFKDMSQLQKQVVLLLGKGHTNKTIAYEIGRSLATVKSHVTTIMRVLGCTNRTQAALLIFQWLAMNNTQSTNL